MTFEHENLLGSVRKPGRYVGREWNSITKSLAETDVSVCLAYPDAYEVGMPNLGLTILYDIINRDPGAVCERVFSPWPDMEAVLRESGTPLWSLETQRPLRDFDMLGITLQYELNYSNILALIELGGIALHASDRKEDEPLVIGGGPCVYNPEPLAPFFDAFVIGDGEEVIQEIIDFLKSTKNTKSTRMDKLQRLSALEGVYVPSLYEPAQGQIKRRILADLESFPPPCRPPVPNLEVVHDRFQVEIMRGCGRSCRFCQAGMVYRPIRERSVPTVLQAVREGLANTGYNEVSLVSLSSTDYTGIVAATQELVGEMSRKAVTVSLPSQRVDAFSVELADIIGGGKKTSLTFAPEAGTQRLRDVINKGVTEEDLMRTAEIAFASGWRKLKLYFMVGLPTETQDDLDGIVDLAYKLRALAMEVVPKNEHGRVNITINVASFIPKAHTPFQWFGQDTLETLRDKNSYLRDRLKKSYLNFKWHEPTMAKLEGALARGDRSVSKAIEAAYKRGARFDSWHEYYDYDLWLAAFADAGLRLEDITDRTRAGDEELPWDFIAPGVSKTWLRKEFEKALDALPTTDCLSGCAGCGIKCQG